MKRLSLRNWIRVIWFSLVTIFMIWEWQSYQAKDVTSDLKQAKASVVVQLEEAKISFFNSQDKSIEVLFFPGGLVDPEAYIPLARILAENGYNTHIIKMPWRMSTKGYNQIKHLFDLNNKDKTYILGGHSQGAKMAAQFVFENENQIDALFLLGTSHPRDIDLSDLDIPCLKLYAEYDGLASVEEVLANKNKLPSGSQLIEVEGGNHAQFAYMGHLLLDGKATISKERQLKLTSEYLLDFFKDLQ